MSGPTFSTRLLVVGTLLFGCSSLPEAEPRPGGGATGTAAGHLTVFVVDDAAGEPRGGVEVRVDGSVATTDVDGRVDFEVDAYDAIEVVADGHTERWLGLRAAVVTVVVEAAETPSPGTFEGTLDIGALEARDAEHRLEAVVSVSHSRRLDRDVPPPSVHCDDARDCAFSFPVSPSTRVVFAEILEVRVDEESPVNVVQEVPALFVSAPETALSGQTTPVTLARVDVTDEVQVETPTGGEGLDAVVGVPGATVGEHVLVFSDRAGDVPRLFPSDSSAVWGVATGRGERGESRSIVRTSSPSGRLAPPALSPMPAVTLDDGTVALPAGDYHVLRSSLETVRVFDARASVQAPAGDGLELEVTEVEMPPSDLGLDAIERDWVRRIRVDL